MTEAKTRTLTRARRRPARVGMSYRGLVDAIAEVHAEAQRHAVQAVNLGLTLRNWLIGYHIVEYEQQGSDRANYGERLIPQLAADLRRRVGKGFTRRNLVYVRLFYQRYPIAKTPISRIQPQPATCRTRRNWPRSSRRSGENSNSNGQGKAGA